MQKYKGLSVCDALPVPPGTHEVIKWKREHFLPHWIFFWHNRCECAKKPGGED